MLFVGFGMPLQELWITSFRAQLQPLVVFSAGAAFDYAAFPEVEGAPLLSSIAILSQLRLVDAKRLRYKIGTVPEGAFGDIKEKIRRLLI